MRDYRFDFANGTTDLVETLSVRTGYVRFYELLSGGGIDPRIRVESMGGGWSVVLRPGQGFRLPDEEAAGVVVSNLSGSAMVGTLKLGPRDWQFEDQRLTGTVAVVDSNYALTTSGLAFAPFLYIAATPGQFSQVQILNQHGSGKIVEVQSLSLNIASAGNVAVDLWSAFILPIGVAPAVTSKLASGFTPSGIQIRGGSSAAYTQGRQLFYYSTGAPNFFTKDYKTPLVLNPGDSIVATLLVGSTAFGMGADIVERPQV
jgi:hypothetical protein